MEKLEAKIDALKYIQEEIKMGRKAEVAIEQYLNFLKEEQEDLKKESESLSLAPNDDLRKGMIKDLIKFLETSDDMEAVITRGKGHVWVRGAE